MRRRIWLLAAAAAALLFPLLWAGKKQPRKADLEVLKIDSSRQEGTIAFEGSIKVTSEKPLVGLVMRFEFYESRGDLLTIQSIQIDDATLPPGEEKHFQVQGRDVPRAVKYTVSASNVAGKELIVTGTGPYPLD